MQKIAFLILPVITFLFGISLGNVEDKSIKSPPIITADKEVVQIPETEKEKENDNNKIDSETLMQAIELIENHYVDPNILEEININQSLLRGLISGLKDPYSDFFDASEANEFFKSLNGNLEGIGARLKETNGIIEVEEVLRDSPAANTGLLPKDIIVSINNEKIEGLSIYQVVEKIRGEKGTPVTLSIIRDSISDIMEIEIIRDIISIESVKLDIDNGIATLTVSQFGQDTPELFQKYLYEALLENPVGIIIDMRYNFGGYLEGAVDLASYFLPKKTPIVSVKYDTDADTLKKDEYFSKGKTIAPIPMVILINGGSASASEIFAGALQDHNRAIIMGENSFGKGSVQQIFHIGNEGDEIKLTIAKWYTPNGRNMLDEPLHPDIKAPMTKEDFLEGKDTPLEKAKEFLILKSRGEEENFSIEEPKNKASE